MGKIHSILIKRAQSASLRTDVPYAEKRKVLNDFNVKPLKRVHNTALYSRYRITRPDKKYEYRTKKINDNVTVVFQY